MPFPRSLAVLAATSVFAACDLSTDVDANDDLVGLAVVTVEDAGNNTATADPVVQFARNATFSIPNTAQRGDQCAGPLDIDDGGGGGGVVTVDAGTSLEWQQGQTQATLVKNVQGGVIRYVAQSAAGIPAQPGELVTLTIPGAADGFPAMMVVGRLAEPIAGLGPINPDPPAGEGLLLTWTASTVANDSAKIEFLLQFSATGNDPDVQIVCQLDDDGTHTVDPTLLTGWRLADDDSRQVIATRYRSTVEEDPDAEFGFLSSSSVTKLTFP